MYYGFIDSHYVGSANHIAYLKKMIEEDLQLFGGCFAVIYRGERCWQVKSVYNEYNNDWHFFKSSTKDRPELPEWAK